MVTLEKGERMFGRISKVLYYLCALIMMIMFLDVLYQVIARLILKVPSTWTVEVGRVSFQAIVFLGMPILIYEKGQMVISTVHSKLKGRALFVVDAISFGLLCFVILAMIWGSGQRMVDQWSVEIPTVEWMHMGYLYLVMFVGSILMLVAYVSNAIDYLKGRNK